jgi:hypothetical protein
MLWFDPMIGRTLNRTCLSLSVDTLVALSVEIGILVVIEVFVVIEFLVLKIPNTLVRLG